MPHNNPRPTSQLARTLAHEWTVGIGVGCVLVASGLLHLLVWAVDGGSWSGPVSWRKPVLFGVSAGATALSLAWVHSQLPASRRPRLFDSLWISAFHLALLVEVTLITIQQWRGVPSHFNRSTTFDAWTLFGIETLIVFVTIVIADVTFRSFVARLKTGSDMALAIRGGMSLLLFACLLGFVLVGYGNAQVEQGSDPGRFGAAGVMKFPHGVPIHAIQFLPLYVVLMKRLDVPPAYRRQATAWLILAFAAFTGFSLVQTFTGRARFDLSLGSAPLLALAIFCVAFSILQILLPRPRTNQEPV